VVSGSWKMIEESGDECRLCKTRRWKHASMAADRYLYFSCMRSSPANTERSGLGSFSEHIRVGICSALPPRLWLSVSQMSLPSPIQAQTIALESHPPLQRLPPSSYHDRQLATSSHVFPYPAVVRSGHIFFRRCSLHLENEGLVHWTPLYPPRASRRTSASQPEATKA
jgi:hypothetical protein